MVLGGVEGLSQVEEHVGEGMGYSVGVASGLPC